MKLSIIALLAAAGVATAAYAQTSPYQIGERVELKASGDHWQQCTVVDPGAVERVMRMRCDPYDDGVYSRGGGIYVEAMTSSGVRRPGTASVATAPRAAAPRSTIATPTRAPTRAPAAAGTGLRKGEYACYGSGGRIMAGLGFKVTSPGRYTDLDGGNAGSFSVGGGNVSFRGGHLGGQTGRNLAGNHFSIGSGASCELYG